MVANAERADQGRPGGVPWIHPLWDDSLAASETYATSLAHTWEYPWEFPIDPIESYDKREVPRMIV